MDGQDQGIWVRLILQEDVEITGMAAGADTPNDFWTKFKTQLVRLSNAQVKRPNDDLREYSSLYVNRDHIVLVEVDDPGV